MFNLCVGSRSRSLTQSTMASDGWLAALEGLDGDPPLAIADGDATLAISDGDAPLAWAAALDGLPSPSSPTSSGIDGEEGEGSALEALALQEGLPEASALHEGLPQLEAWVPFSRTWRDDALDQPAVEAAKYFTKEKVLVCSSEAQAEALGISARDVASLRTLTAAASIELEGCSGSSSRLRWWRLRGRSSSKRSASSSPTMGWTWRCVTRLAFLFRLSQTMPSLTMQGRANAMEARRQVTTRSSSQHGN